MEAAPPELVDNRPSLAVPKARKKSEAVNTAAAMPPLVALSPTDQADFDRIALYVTSSALALVLWTKVLTDAQRAELSRRARALLPYNSIGARTDLDLCFNELAGPIGMWAALHPGMSDAQAFADLAVAFGLAHSLKRLTLEEQYRGQRVVVIRRPRWESGRLTTPDGHYIHIKTPVTSSIKPVLDALQQSGWNEYVLSPLPGTETARLRRTVYAVNKKLAAAGSRMRLATRANRITWSA